MTDATWPPSAELLRWRPIAESPNASVSTGDIGEGEEGRLPDWVSVPADSEPGDYGEIPAHVLAHVETDAGRPGGLSGSSIVAVPTVDGRFRVVITNDDEIRFESPIQIFDELPT